jgi:uncharacterized protein
MFILLAFGLLHGFGIWWGDILTLYAVAGMVLFFFRSLSSKHLLLIGALLYLGVAATKVPLLQKVDRSSTVSSPDMTASQHDAASIAAKSSASIQSRVSAVIDEATSSWAGAYRVNTAEHIRLLRGNISLLPHTLALMMIGLGLFKSGFFAARSSSKSYTGVVIVGVPFLLLAGWTSWKTVVLATKAPWLSFLADFSAPVVALTYVSVLMLLLRSGVARVLSPFAAAGRMAFTNYLTQSLIMTSIFYGGRGALMGQLDRPALWVIVLVVWALQLWWSAWWMSRFCNGPLEWIWRSLTIGRRAPMLRP